ncbi:aldo/keto reductase [Sphingomonas pruni]|uniref:aldo/keto reductase n=1 Tax=Sphingomonas pruni TaxID=40683 RepID=UPI00083289F7|nr:aldo/keto reductase [Sphingomonas pruni]
MTGLTLPPIGFGTAPLGNLYRPVDDETAEATITAAVRAGLLYADTAPYYGFGLAETRLGQAIAGNRDVVISTKVGRVLEPLAGSAERERHGFVDAPALAPVYDYSRDGILRSHEASLKRLGRDHIDILYVHDIGRRVHGAAHDARMSELLDKGGFAALEELREQGAVSAIGVGVNETAVCLELMEHVSLDIILLAGRYTLLEQSPVDELFPRCAATGTALVLAGVYNSGILALGADAPAAHYDYAGVPEAIRQRTRAIERICAAHDVALPAAALQFVLAHPQAASVIIGLASADEVRATMTNIAAPAPDGLWSDLKAAGLLRADVPVPATTE